MKKLILLALFILLAVGCKPSPPTYDEWVTSITPETIYVNENGIGPLITNDPNIVPTPQNGLTLVSQKRFIYKYNQLKIPFNHTGYTSIISGNRPSIESKSARITEIDGIHVEWNHCILNYAFDFDTPVLEFGRLSASSGDFDRCEEDDLKALFYTWRLEEPMTFSAEQVTTALTNQTDREENWQYGIAEITQEKTSPYDPEMQEFWITDSYGKEWLIAIKKIPNNAVMMGAMAVKDIDHPYFYEHFFLQFIMTETTYYK